MCVLELSTVPLTIFSAAVGHLLVAVFLGVGERPHHLEADPRPRGARLPVEVP